MLGYLAIQIRQSAKALKTSSLYQANAQISETMLTDSELQFGEDVSADQKEQLLNRLAQRFVLYEWFFYQFRDGNVDTEIWEAAPIRSSSSSIRLWEGRSGPSAGSTLQTRSEGLSTAWKRRRRTEIYSAIDSVAGSGTCETFRLACPRFPRRR